MHLRFNDCELDTDRAELWRRGELVDVQPLVFAVIEFLVRHRDRVVAKEELLDTLWGDRFVSESALTSRIKFARRAVGDDGREQSVIRTVHGHGYRFVAEVTDAALPNGAVVPPTTVADERPNETWPFVGRSAELSSVLGATTAIGVGGVIINGPGSTRFAEECVRQLSTPGTIVWRVHGLAGSSEIPLSSIAHLVPSYVLDTGNLSGDLARAALFRAALDDLDRLRAGKRPILMIDDVQLLDPLSATVLASLVGARTVFAVVTGHVSTGDAPFDGLARRGALHPVELGPLTEVDVDVLLYRVLGGPIDEATMATLLRSSRGRPGILRDLVDASRRCGALVDIDGVWQLAAPPVSSYSTAWPPEDLSTSAVEAAARLALLGQARWSVLTTLLDETALDELDDAGLLAVDGSPADPDIDLRDPLLVAAVMEATGALRLRRLRAELAAALRDRPMTPWAAARIIGWSLELDEGFDDATLLDHALLALIDGEFADAETLADAIDAKVAPGALVLRAELADRRNQWQRCIRLLDDVDLDEVGPLLAALAIRRRWTIAFTHEDRREEALAALADPTPGPDFVRHALAVRRLGLLATAGEYQHILDEAGPLLESEGISRVEILGSLAVATLGQGRIAEADPMVEEALLLARTTIPTPWRTEALDALLTTQAGILLQEGDLPGATALVHTHMPTGRRSRLGILPTIGAEIELEAGRPQAAQELIRATMDSNLRDGFPHYVGLAEAVLARTEVARGDRAAADRGVEAGLAALPAAVGVARWRIGLNVADLLAALGRDDQILPLLLPLADEAGSSGAFVAESDLLFAAAILSPGPSAARSILDRFDARAESFGGRLWPVRRRHVEAVANARPTGDIAAAYADLGYVRWSRCASGPAS